MEQGTLVCQTTAHHLLLKLLSHGSLVTQRMTLEYFQVRQHHASHACHSIAQKACHHISFHMCVIIYHMPFGMSVMKHFVS